MFYLLKSEGKLMEQLIPFEFNVIYELIVSTYNQDGSPNASTMGIILDKNNNVIIKPFLDTDTCNNLLKNKECILNITNDPELFVISTLFQEEFNEKQFIKEKHVNAPLLKSCENNYIALQVISNEKIAPYRMSFHCKIINHKSELVKNKPFTRAFSSLIEILIHATRIIAFSKNPVKNYHVIKLLITQVKFHSNIIKRVSEKESNYQFLLEKVLTKLAPYMDKLSE
ncbi:MAG: DUF447 family protein [Asgard group archaeon]|nr:DUF447 family protein [Asgard group archaeon]